MSQVISLGDYKGKKEQPSAAPNSRSGGGAALREKPDISLRVQVVIYCMHDDDLDDVYTFNPFSRREWIENIEREVRKFKARYEDEFADDEVVQVMFSNWVVREGKQGDYEYETFDHPKWHALYQILDRADGIGTLLYNNEFMFKLDLDEILRRLDTLLIDLSTSQQRA